MSVVSSEKQDAGTFKAEIDPKLDQQLKRLQKALAESEGDKRKQYEARIKRVEKLIADQTALQEQVWKRANGNLAPVGNAAGIVYREVITKARCGKEHRDFVVIPRFTPSTAVPIQNPERVRRRIEQITGRLSGRQWVKVRKAVKRQMRAEVNAELRVKESE